VVRPEKSHPRRPDEEPDRDACVIVAWSCAVACSVIHLDEAAKRLRKLRVDRSI
jgi:hypothetical protein